MGRRGPPPKPTALRVLEGNPGKKKLDPREPRPTPGAPGPPAWLSPLASAKWAELCPQLERLGVLTRVDGDALAAYCETWVRWRRAEDFLSKNGEVYPLKDEKGEIRCLQQFPQVAIARTLLQAIVRYQQEFGLTPAARTRLQTFEEAPEGEDGAAEARFFGRS